MRILINSVFNSIISDRLIEMDSEVLCTSYLVLSSYYPVKLDLQTIGFSHSFALMGFGVQALS